MNVLILYAHPEPASFTAALKDTAVATLEARGHEVTVSDLYAEGFNPARAGNNPRRVSPEVLRAMLAGTW